MNPLVSIIIPVFNREELIAETLDSVLDQKYTNWECIVVDDGSTDQSKEVIAKYCNKDSRIKFYQRPDFKIKGASACRNYGFEKSEGKLIQYLDSDDLLDPQKLKEQVDMCKKSKNSVLFTGKWGWFSDRGSLNNRFKNNYKSYRNFSYPWKLLNTFGLFNEFFPPIVYLIPRKLILKSGNWNESLTNNDDAEFIARVILNADKILFCPTAKAYYRVSSSNDQLSNINSKEKIISSIKSWSLIESEIRKKSNGKGKSYYRNAIYFLYHQNKEKFPTVIQENQSLFEKRKNYNSFYFKLLKKITSKISN